jgi:hypothetical protein
LLHRTAADEVTELGGLAFADQGQVLLRTGAALERLIELFERDQYFHRLTGLGVVQRVGGLGVKIGGLQCDQTVGLTTDFDAAQHRQRGSAAHEFVEAGQRLFQFRYGEGDFGIH